MKTVEFIKEFTSPVYGYVYLGKRVSVKSHEAEKLISCGLAQDVAPIVEDDAPKTTTRRSYTRKK